MEQNEGYIDMIINSLKYSISDTGALLWGGVAALGSMLLIGLPFLFGYITQCGRELIHGNGKLPPWDNLGGKFGDGIMVFVIMLVFGLISGLLYVLVVPFIVIGAITGSGLLLFAGIFMLLPVMAVSGIIGILMPAAWVEYAVTGDLVRAINPINALRLAAKNPMAFIGAVVATVVIQFIMAIPSVLIVTIPWTTFAMYTASAYVYAWFYGKTNTVQPIAGTGSPAPAAV